MRFQMFMGAGVVLNPPRFTTVQVAETQEDITKAEVMLDFGYKGWKDKLLCTFWRDAADRLEEFGIQPGDNLWLTGRIKAHRQRGKMELSYNVSVSSWQYLWPNPSRVYHRHKLLRKDEYERLKALEKSHYDIPQEALEALDLVDLSEDDPGHSEQE